MDIIVCAVFSNHPFLENVLRDERMRVRERGKSSPNGICGGERLYLVVGLPPGILPASLMDSYQVR